MTSDEFKEYLFLLSSDIHEEYWEIESECGVSQLNRWTIKILTNWEKVAKGLSHKDQNKLLWRIQGEPMWIGWWLRVDSKLDLDEQIALVQAAQHVTLAIPKLFPQGEPMENGYFMWWDSLASSVTVSMLSAVCLEVLTDLSMHKDFRVQYAALHGLGHLHHPDKPMAIDRYIQFHPDAKGNKWLEQCRDGTVM